MKRTPRAMIQRDLTTRSNGDLALICDTGHDTYGAEGDSISGTA